MNSIKLLLILGLAAGSMAHTAPAQVTINETIGMPGGELETIPAVIFLVYGFQTASAFLRYDLVYGIIDSLPVALYMFFFYLGKTVDAETTGIFGTFGIHLTTFSYYLAMCFVPPAFIQGMILLYFFNFRAAPANAEDIETIKGENKLLNKLWTASIAFKAIYIILINLLISYLGVDLTSFAKMTSSIRFHTLLKSVGTVGGLLNTFGGLFVATTPLFYIIMSLSYRPNIIF